MENLVPGALLGGSAGADIPKPLAYGLNAPIRTKIGNTSAVGNPGIGFTAQDINGLLSGSAWDTHSITYSFPASAANYGSGYGAGEPMKGFHALSSAQQSVVRYALNLISQYTLLTFTQITESNTTHAMIRFGDSAVPPTSWTYLPSASKEGGDVWLGNIANVVPTKGSYAYVSILHEIGHALGLKHGQESDGKHGVLPAGHDSGEWSVMDYHSYLGSGLTYTNAAGSGNRTYMIDDIAALQSMYGANYSTNAGNTTYSWSPTTGEMFINGVGQGASTANKIYEAIWDGGGTDTYDLSNYKTNLSIDLRPGAWSTFSTAQLADLGIVPGAHLAHGNVDNTYLYNNDPRSLIENAIGGTGNDTLVGNQADNTLSGNAGNDSLTGNEGNDTLLGGPGNDTVEGGPGNDSMDGGDGVDTLSYANATGGITANLTLQGSPQDTGAAGTDTFFNFENLTGSAYNDSLAGSPGPNVLTGLGGNDVLNGGPGSDSLTGNQGADTFYFNAGFGTDAVTDFTATGSGHDVIDFAATLFPNYATLSSQMTQVGSAVVITYDGSDTVTLIGVKLASLSAADFNFHGAAANAQIHIA